MKALIPVSDIMTKNVVALERNDNLTRAEQLFKRHNIRHMPVVHEDFIIGMLSYSDLLKISFADASIDNRDVDAIVYNMFSLEQVMTKDVITVNSETSIKEAAEILADREFHALPVVDNGNLVGIITTTDLIKYLINQF